MTEVDEEMEDDFEVCRVVWELVEEADDEVVVGVGVGVELELEGWARTTGPKVVYPAMEPAKVCEAVT